MMCLNDSNVNNMLTIKTYPTAQNCDEDTVVPNGKITGPTPYISPGSKLLIQCSQGYKEVDINITCITLNKFNPEDGINRSADFLMTTLFFVFAFFWANNSKQWSIFVDFRCCKSEIYFLLS